MRRFEKEDILMEDENILVVHKHAGMAVQSARPGQMDLEHELLNYMASGVYADRERRIPYLGVIHRLDQPVEGILVFARTPSAAAGLNHAMQKHKIEKFYLAVTNREPKKKEGILTDFLKKDGRKNISSVVSAREAGAKRAELFYQLIRTADTPDGTRFLIEIHLGTGRHHQIRVQMAHAGMPLCGDEKYHPDAEKWNIRIPLALCAYHLTFPHPVSGKTLSFEVRPEGSAFRPFLIQK